MLDKINSDATMPKKGGKEGGNTLYTVQKNYIRTCQTLKRNITLIKK